MARENKAPKGCELVMCKDPKTGKVVVKPKGKCPPGYVEMIKKQIRDDGIYFTRDRVKDLDE
jgi:hypothetical protein